MEYLSISAEAASLGEAVIVGIAMGLYFDCFKIIRKFHCFSYSAILAQDLFFWFTAAIGVFFATTWLCDGIVRIYFILFAFVGWAAYSATVGALLMLLVDLLLKLFKLVVNALKHIFSPLLNSVSKTIRGINTNIVNKAKNISFYTKKIKNKPCNPAQE